MKDYPHCRQLVLTTMEVAVTDFLHLRGRQSMSMVLCHHQFASSVVQMARILTFAPVRTSLMKNLLNFVLVQLAENLNEIIFLCF